jgi:hypothetical protein
MRPRALILIAAFTVSFATSVHCVEYSKSMNSAAFIYGNANGVTAFLFECADYDKQNAAAYMDVFEQYVRETKSLMDRVVMIMQTEQSRSGQPVENLSKALAQSKNIAAEGMEKMRREDPKFLSNCRAQPELHRRGVAMYKSFRDQFPEQMLVIDQWK